jgi:fibronectin type 3 domain-containing protein
VGETEATSYLDTQFDLGKSYVYTVRSVLRYDEEQIESADSNPFVVLARDVSPPASPRGLIVVYVPAQDTVPAHLELSWGISPETDLAGYNVYRSEQAGLPGTRMNSELLLTPAFRDMNAAPGRLYFYSVGAVDRSGNESPASAAVAGTVPAESQTTQ